MSDFYLPPLMSLFFLIAAASSPAQPLSQELQFEDRSLSKLCFPAVEVEENRNKRKSTVWGQDARKGSRSIRLEVRSWMSHQLTTRMAEILLREQLGIDTTVASFEASDRTHTRSTASWVCILA